MSDVVSLVQVLAAAHGGSLSLAPESVGYLALELVEAISAARSRGVGGPTGGPGAGSWTEAETRLRVDGMFSVAGRPDGAGPGPEDDEPRVRRLFADLLARSNGHAPALVAIAAHVGGEGLEALRLELTAALIPLNRAAGRRALARLSREVLRTPVHSEGRAASVVIAPDADIADTDPLYVPPVHEESVAPTDVAVEAEASRRNEPPEEPAVSEEPLVETASDEAAVNAEVSEGGPVEVAVSDEAPVEAVVSEAVPVEAAASDEPLAKANAPAEPSEPAPSNERPLEPAPAAEPAPSNAVEEWESALAASASDEPPTVLEQSSDAATHEAARTIPSGTATLETTRAAELEVARTAELESARATELEAGRAAETMSEPTPPPSIDVVETPAPEWEVEPTPPPPLTDLVNSPAPEKVAQASPLSPTTRADQLIAELGSAAVRDEARVAADLKASVGLDPTPLPVPVSTRSMRPASSEESAIDEVWDSLPPPPPSAIGSGSIRRSSSWEPNDPPPDEPLADTQEPVERVSQGRSRSGRVAFGVLLVAAIAGAVAWFAMHQPAPESEGTGPSSSAPIAGDNPTGAMASSAAGEQGAVSASPSSTAPLGSASPLAACATTLVVDGAPASAEVLMRVGAAPIALPDLVAEGDDVVVAAEGFAPRRHRIPPAAADTEAPREIDVRLEHTGRSGRGAPWEPWPPAVREGRTTAKHHDDAMSGEKSKPSAARWRVVAKPASADVWVSVGHGPAISLAGLACGVPVDLLIAGEHRHAPPRRVTVPASVLVAPASGGPPVSHFSVSP